MSIIELGAIGEFVGAIAVVTTLIYLTLQVRHGTEQTALNTQALELSAYQQLIGHISEFNVTTIQNSELRQVRDKVDIPSDVHEKILDKLQEKMEKKYDKIITIDGIKAIVDDDTWVLVRKSNTEDIIRISAESNSLEKVATIQQEVKYLVKQSYEQVK